MPSKSRRKRGKRSFQGRQGRRQVPSTSNAPPPAVTPPSAPEAAPPVSAVEPAPHAARYPHVTGELKRIGIIAAIMVSVLVILSRVAF